LFYITTLGSVDRILEGGRRAYHLPLAVEVGDGLGWWGSHFDVLDGNVDGYEMTWVEKEIREMGKRQ
jgi:hypothetical protein